MWTYLNHWFNLTLKWKDVDDEVTVDTSKISAQDDDDDGANLNCADLRNFYS